jgi:hypothetical protein
VFPIMDSVPSRSVPVVTRTLILINVVVFFFELALPQETLVELTNKKLTECLIYRKPGLEVRIRLTDQLQRIQVSQKVENGLLLKAAREIPSGVLEPFADFFPPTHC